MKPERLAHIGIRVTPEEKDVLSRVAGIRESSLSEYIRTLALRSARATLLSVKHKLNKN